jgi:hypothetical protein
MAHFGQVTEDPEYDDDATWQDLEDYDEDESMDYVDHEFTPFSD